MLLTSFKIRFVDVCGLIEQGITNEKVSEHLKWVHYAVIALKRWTDEGKNVICRLACVTHWLLSILKVIHRMIITGQYVKHNHALRTFFIFDQPTLERSTLQQKPKKLIPYFSPMYSRSLQTILILQYEIHNRKCNIKIPILYLNWSFFSYITLAIYSICCFVFPLSLDRSPQQQKQEWTF